MFGSVAKNKASGNPQYPPKYLSQISCLEKTFRFRDENLEK